MKRLFLISLILFVFISSYAQTTQTHVVKRGETPESVAAKYGISTDALKSANPNMNNLFYVGMKLNIPQLLSTKDEATPNPTISETVDLRNDTTHLMRTVPISTISETTSSFITDSITASPVSITTETQGQNGLATDAWDYLFIVRPKDKYYGFHIGNNTISHLYTSVNMGLGLQKHASTYSFTVGLGCGEKYKMGALIIQGAVYPYFGLFSFDYPEVNVKLNKAGMPVTDTKYKTKTELTYGIAANIGMGVRVFTNKKNKKYYLTIGYYMAAEKFKTDNMVKNGTWMVGLTTAF